MDDSLNTAHDEPTYAGRIGLRAQGLLVLAVAAAAFLYAFFLARNLFIFHEARFALLYAWPLDLVRFFFLPHLDWGWGRLFGTTTFHLAGSMCGVDWSCINGVAASLVSIGAAVVVLHTWQLTRSLLLAIVAASLWCVSAPVLGTLVWQATWFDLLAFIFALASSAFWWATLGAAAISRTRGVVLATIGILFFALALNSKESDIYLVVALPMIAVLRGWPDRIRRNLTIIVVPVAYALWWFGYGIATAPADYLSHSGGVSIADGLPVLFPQLFGLGPSFMYLWEPTPELAALQGIAVLGFAIWAVALVLGLAYALRRGRFFTPMPIAEVYLASIAIGTLLVFSRSAGATAYYLIVPYWALVTLGLLVSKRIAAALPRPRIVLAGLIALYTIPAVVAYAGLFVTAQSGYAQFTRTSDRLATLGAEIRSSLGARPVTEVNWRTEGAPLTAFYVLGDPRGPDFWPYLVDGSTPKVNMLAEGSALDLSARVSEFAQPGEVMVVTSEGYELELLVYEGRTLVGP